MRVKFYTEFGKPLWDDMKCKICDNILNNIGGDRKLRYYIHFDKMLFRIGWFTGFVEIWKGKVPYEKNRRQIPFTVHVTDWGTRADCREWPDYRVKEINNA